MTSEENVIRVGSRKSELALIQTEFVIEKLKEVYSDKEFTIVTMTTLGDRRLDVSLPKIGEKSLFTKDLEDALRAKTVDFVVHSLKDLPTTLPDGLAIGAVFERKDPRDALVLRKDIKDCTLATLPKGSVVGTSSLRRTAQLKGSYPHLSVVDVRGNLNTRLRKLDAGQEYSALLLAYAGLQRMGWDERVSKILPCSEMMYAVGQGALAVECRADDDHILGMLSTFNHPETYCRVLAERSFLKTLGGGCSAPVGVSTRLKPLDSQFKLSITGGVWSLEGDIRIDHTLDQTFAQITKSQKHKLSPTDEVEPKKLKVDNEDEKNGSENSIEVNTNVIEKASSTDINIVQDTTQTFCGLTANLNVPMDVIAKCDSLGRDLANKLISKGALDVMKISQDYIRSSTVKNS